MFRSGVVFSPTGCTINILELSECIKRKDRRALPASCLLVKLSTIPHPPIVPEHPLFDVLVNYIARRLPQPNGCARRNNASELDDVWIGHRLQFALETYGRFLYLGATAQDSVEYSFWPVGVHLVPDAWFSSVKFVRHLSVQLIGLSDIQTDTARKRQTEQRRTEIQAETTREQTARQPWCDPLCCAHVCLCVCKQFRLK